MAQVPTTDEWKDWIESDYVCSVQLKDRARQIVTFPVYSHTTQEWLIFKPWADDYMVVSGEEYEAHRVKRYHDKHTS